MARQLLLHFVWCVHACTQHTKPETAVKYPKCWQASHTCDRRYKVALRGAACNTICRIDGTQLLKGQQQQAGVLTCQLQMPRQWCTSKQADKCQSSVEGTDDVVPTSIAKNVRGCMKTMHLVDKTAPGTKQTANQQHVMREEKRKYRKKREEEMLAQ